MICSLIYPLASRWCYSLLSCQEKHHDRKQLREEWACVTFQAMTHCWGRSGQSLGEETWTNVLSCLLPGSHSHSAAFLHSSGPPSSGWHWPPVLGSPTWVSNQDNALQTCPQYFNWGSFFPGQSRWQPEGTIIHDSPIWEIYYVPGIASGTRRGDRKTDEAFALREVLV